MTRADTTDEDQDELSVLHNTVSMRTHNNHHEPDTMITDDSCMDIRRADDVGNNNHYSKPRNASVDGIEVVRRQNANHLDGVESFRTKWRVLRSARRGDALTNVEFPTQRELDLHKQESSLFKT
jgi:hypothetical protein